jgi:hypothetical protein
MEETDLIQRILDTDEKPPTEIDYDHLFWLLMNRDIHNYLMCNTKGREDGYAKATYHGNLCDIFCACLFKCEIDEILGWSHTSHIRKLHEESQSLTNHLGTEIGFDRKDEDPDYDKYARLFFDKFLKIAMSTIQKTT